MLSFNIRRVFALRGIENPLVFMMKNGFIRPTASGLLNRRAAGIKFEHLEKLCLMLNCTPNDLFEWKTDAKSVVAENHPLQTLKRAENVRKFTELLKDIPMEQMEKIETLLSELKNG